MITLKTKLWIFLLMLFLINHFSTNVAFVYSMSGSNLLANTDPQNVTNMLFRPTTNLTDSITPNTATFDIFGVDSSGHFDTSNKITKKSRKKSNIEKIKKTRVYSKKIYTNSTTIINGSSTKIKSKRRKFKKTGRNRRRRLRSSRVSFLSVIYQTSVPHLEKSKTTFGKNYTISKLTYPSRWSNLMTDDELEDSKCPSLVTSSKKIITKFVKKLYLDSFDENASEYGSIDPLEDDLFSTTPQSTMETGIWFANDSLTLIFNRKTVLNISVMTPTGPILNPSQKSSRVKATLKGSTLSRVNTNVANRSNSNQHASLQNLTTFNLTFDDAKATTCSIYVNSITKIIVDNVSEKREFGNKTILGARVFKPKASSDLVINNLSFNLSSKPNTAITVSTLNINALSYFENASEFSTISSLQNKITSDDYERNLSAKPMEVVTRNRSTLTSTLWEDLQNVSCPPLHFSKIFSPFLIDELYNETSRSTSFYFPILASTRKRDKSSIYFPDYSCPRRMTYSPSWAPRKTTYLINSTKCPIRLRQADLTTHPFTLDCQNSTNSSNVIIFSYSFPGSFYPTDRYTYRFKTTSSTTFMSAKAAIVWTYGSFILDEKPVNLTSPTLFPLPFFYRKANGFPRTVDINDSDAIPWRPIIHVITQGSPSNPTTVDIRCTSVRSSGLTWITRIFLWTPRLSVRNYSSRSNFSSFSSLTSQDTSSRCPTTMDVTRAYCWSLKSPWWLSGTTPPFTTLPFYLNSSYCSVLTTPTPNIRYSFYLTSQCLIYSKGTYIWKQITLPWRLTVTLSKWFYSTAPSTYRLTETYENVNENEPKQIDHRMAPNKRLINADTEFNIKQTQKSESIIENDKTRNLIEFNDLSTTDNIVGEVEYILTRANSYGKSESILKATSKHLAPLRTKMKPLTPFKTMTKQYAILKTKSKHLVTSKKLSTLKNSNLKQKTTEKPRYDNDFKIKMKFEKTIVVTKAKPRLTVKNLNLMAKLTTTNLNQKQFRSLNNEKSIYLNQKQFRSANNEKSFTLSADSYLADQNLKEYGNEIIPLTSKTRTNFDECNLLNKREWFPSQAYSSTLEIPIERNFEFVDNKKMQTSIRSKRQPIDKHCGLSTCYLKVMKACSVQDCLSTRGIDMLWTPSGLPLGPWNREYSFSQFLPPVMKSTVTTYSWMAPSTTVTKYYQRCKTFNPHQTCIHLGGHLTTVCTGASFYRWECRRLNSLQYIPTSTITKRTRCTMQSASKMPTLQWDHWLVSPRSCSKKRISIKVPCQMSTGNLPSPLPTNFVLQHLFVDEREGKKRELDDIISGCHCQLLPSGASCNCENAKSTCNCNQIPHAYDDAEPNLPCCEKSTVWPSYSCKHAENTCNCNQMARAYHGAKPNLPCCIKSTLWPSYTCKHVKNTCNCNQITHAYHDAEPNLPCCIKSTVWPSYTCKHVENTRNWNQITHLYHGIKQNLLCCEKSTVWPSYTCKHVENARNWNKIAHVYHGAKQNLPCCEKSTVWPTPTMRLISVVCHDTQPNLPCCKQFTVWPTPTMSVVFHDAKPIVPCCVLTMLQTYTMHPTYTMMSTSTAMSTSTVLSTSTMHPITTALRTSTMGPTSTERLTSVLSTAIVDSTIISTLKNNVFGIDLNSLKLTLNYLIGFTFPRCCSTTTPSLTTSTSGFVTPTTNIYHLPWVDLNAFQMTLSYLLAVTLKNKQNDCTRHTTISSVIQSSQSCSNKDIGDPYDSKIDLNALRQTLSYLMGITFKNVPDDLTTTSHLNFCTPPCFGALSLDLNASTASSTEKNILHFTLHLDDVTHLIGIKLGTTIAPTVLEDHCLITIAPNVLDDHCLTTITSNDIDDCKLDNCPNIMKHETSVIKNNRKGNYVLSVTTAFTGISGCYLPTCQTSSCVTTKTCNIKESMCDCVTKAYNEDKPVSKCYGVTESYRKKQPNLKCNCVTELDNKYETDTKCYYLPEACNKQETICGCVTKAYNENRSVSKCYCVTESCNRIESTLKFICTANSCNKNILRKTCFYNQKTGSKSLSTKTCNKNILRKTCVYNQKTWSKSFYLSTKTSKLACSPYISSISWLTENCGDLNVRNSWKIIFTTSSTTTWRHAATSTSPKSITPRLTLSSVTWPHWLIKQHITRKSYTNLPPTYAGLILPSDYLLDKHRSTCACARDCWMSKTTQKCSPTTMFQPTKRCKSASSALAAPSSRCICQREAGLKNWFVTMAWSFKEWENAQQLSAHTTVATTSTVSPAMTINWLQLLLTAGIFRIKTTSANKGRLPIINSPKPVTFKKFPNTTFPTAIVSVSALDTKLTSKSIFGQIILTPTTLKSTLTTLTLAQSTSSTKQSPSIAAQSTLSTIKSTSTTIKSALTKIKSIPSTAQITLSTIKSISTTTQSTSSTKMTSLTTQKFSWAASRTIASPISTPLVATTTSVKLTIAYMSSKANSKVLTTLTAVPPIVTQGDVYRNHYVVTLTMLKLLLPLPNVHQFYPTTLRPTSTLDTTVSTSTTTFTTENYWFVSQTSFQLPMMLFSYLCVEFSTCPTSSLVCSTSAAITVSSAATTTTVTRSTSTISVSIISASTATTTRSTSKTTCSIYATTTKIARLISTKFAFSSYSGSAKLTISTTANPIKITFLTSTTLSISVSPAKIKLLTTSKKIFSFATLPLGFSLPSIAFSALTTTRLISTTTRPTSTTTRPTSTTTCSTSTTTLPTSTPTSPISTTTLATSTTTIPTLTTTLATSTTTIPTLTTTRVTSTTFRATSTTTSPTSTITSPTSTTTRATSTTSTAFATSTCYTSSSLCLFSVSYPIVFPFSYTIFSSTSVSGPIAYPVSTSYPIARSSSVFYQTTCLTSTSFPITCSTSVSYPITCPTSVSFLIATSDNLPFSFPDGICKTHEQMFPKFDWRMLMNGGKSSPGTWGISFYNLSNPFVVRALWLLKRNNSMLKLNFETDKTKTAISHGVSKIAYNDIVALPICIIFVKLCV